MNSEFPILIEKAIPLPPPRSPSANSALAKVLKSMEVGDSFLLPEEMKANTVCGRAHMLGLRIAERSIEINGKRRIRIWRVQ